MLAWDVTEKQQNGLGNTNPREARMIWLTKDAATTIAGGCHPPLCVQAQPASATLCKTFLYQPFKPF